MKPKEFLVIVKNLFVKRQEFIEEIKDDKGIKRALSYFIFLTLGVVIFSTYRYIGSINGFLRTMYTETGIDAFNINIPLTPQVYLGFFVGLAIAVVLFSFAKYWFTHIFVLIFNHDAKYKDTYNSLTYTITPAYLGIPFFVVGLVLISFINNIFLLVLGIISLIIYVILEIYALYIRTKGLAKIHHIKVWQSFISIYVLSSIAMGFALVVLLGLVLVPAMLVAI